MKNHGYVLKLIAEKLQSRCGFVQYTAPPVAYAGFSKGGAGNLRIMKTKRKISPLRISLFFCPKLGEDQKKKKKAFSQILSVTVLKLSAQVTMGGAMPQFYMLFYANYAVLATQRGGPWHHAPPLNTSAIVV